MLLFKFPVSAGTHRGFLLLSPHFHTILSMALQEEFPCEGCSLSPNSTQTHEKSYLVYVYVKQIAHLKVQIMKHGAKGHQGFQQWMFSSAGGWPAWPAGFASGRVSSVMYHVLCTESECTPMDNTSACGINCPASGKLRLSISLASLN